MIRVPAAFLALVALAAAIPLGTGTATVAPDPELWSGKPGARSVRNVSTASLLPVLPDPAKANGAAVIVAPGGAFMTLAWDQEGMNVARALAAHGIAAFVLKYRLDPTPPAMAAFAPVIVARMRAWIERPGMPLDIVTPPSALADVRAALRLVRARAAAWHVDPKRVGMIGFSAGARLTVAAAIAADRDDRPAFVAPIYPPMEQVAVPPDAPPMFVAMAADDPLFGHAGFGLVEDWSAARRPLEFHDLQRGGHGFGLGRSGTTTEGWLTLLLTWLSVGGWLGDKP